MVLFRALQGISGAFIVPLAQATLFDINPREKHGQAMALFGGGVMIGPILGPVLGGWLTDNYNWRWVFLVNLPVGVICTFLMLRYMPKTDKHRRGFDLLGFALLAIALGSLQMFLDRGEQKDWFESWEIIAEAGLAIAAAWMFVVHLVTAKNPLFERSMFADRNFSTGLLFMAVTGVLLLAGLALLPPLLQNLYGYSVLQSGFLTAPRGVGTLISMLLAGRLTGKIDARLLVGIGVALMGISLWMMTGFALDQPSTPVITSGVVQGLGLGLIFVPLQSLAFETLAPRMRTTGGGASEPVAQHRRLGRHFDRQRAARPDDSGCPRRHGELDHGADDPDGRSDASADDRAAGLDRAGHDQCRSDPAGGVHRLSRRLQADDAGDLCRSPAAATDAPCWANRRTAPGCDGLI